MDDLRYFHVKWIIFCLAILMTRINCSVLKENEFLTDQSEFTKNGANSTENSSKFQVFRIVPKNDEELVILNTLYGMSAELQLDFWKAPTGIRAFVDVMVNPEFLEETKLFFDQNNIDYTVIINDVQRLIMQREKSQARPRVGLQTSDFNNNPFLMSFFSKRMKDDTFSSRNKAKYGFGDYHSYVEMMQWMSDIETNYAQMARVFTIGTTHEGRPIRGIKIGNPVSDATKRAVWIDGGMHAREWAAIHTALYFIEQLISLYGVDPKITVYVDTLNFYVVPVANPDGFEYSRSDVTPQTRFWRKNRGNQVCKKDRWRRERCCGGVDLNRNFDFHWGEIGSSEDLCSDIFQGTSAFSEPESRAIRDKMLSPELNGKVDAFITLHTYSQMWIHPYNHERKSFPEDIQELQTIGKQGVDAIESVYGTKFRFGTGADILYPSAGGSDDWAKAHAHVKFVYLLELRPGEEEWDGFLLDRRQLIPTGRETWEGVKVVIDAVIKKSQKQPKFLTVAKPPMTSFVPTFAPTTLPPATVTQSVPIFLPQQRPTFPVATLPPASFAPSQPRQTQQQRFQTQQPTSQQQQQQQQMWSTPFQRFTTTVRGLEVNRRGDATVLRNSLQERLRQLQVTAQMEARQNYEQKLQLAEQQRQLLFWQNQQNRLHSGCSDRSPWCVNWIHASPQICRTSTIYMRQDCRSTCGFCSQSSLTE